MNLGAGTLRKHGSGITDAINKEWIFFKKTLSISANPAKRQVHKVIISFNVKQTKLFRIKNFFVMEFKLSQKGDGLFLKKRIVSQKKGDGLDLDQEQPKSGVNYIIRPF
jgi:hypothetical protein